MTDAQTLLDELDEQQVTGNQVTVTENDESGTIVLAADDGEAELDAGEARAFADELQAHAEDEGWYHAGQTKPLLDEIRQSAESVA